MAFCNSDEQTCQKQRKIASHVFTSRRLKEDMSAVFSRNAKSVIARIKRHAVDQRPFGMQDLFFRHALESLAEIAFGQTVGQLQRTFEAWCDDKHARR